MRDLPTGRTPDRQFRARVHLHWGSFAELVAIDHAQVNLVRGAGRHGLRDPAASLDSRYNTAYRVVVHHGRVQSGDWVVVHGCGGIRRRGDRRRSPRRTDHRLRHLTGLRWNWPGLWGQPPRSTPGTIDVVNAVRDLTGGGAQVSIDALGSIETCQNSIRSLRKRGRHVQVGLMLGADDAPSVPMSTVIAAELEIVGSHGMAAHDYPTMLAEITAGTLSPQRLVQHRIDLSEAPAKLAALDQQPGNGITIISPTPLAP